MRKLLFALMLALSTFGAYASPTKDNPPATYQEFVQAHENWNRFATIVRKSDGKAILEREPNTQNPFASKAECTEGLASDTYAIFEYLHSQGVDIERIDVNVVCEPAGQGI